MLLRVALGLAALAVLAGLILDLSGSAPRSAGSDHVSPAVFAASVPGGGTLCQPISPLPGDAARAQLLIGTYGRPVPRLRVRFSDAAGSAVAGGDLPAGAGEGYVTVPLHHEPRALAATRACVAVGGSTNVVFGGEAGSLGAASELVNGKPQGGRISMLYLRAGKESWWQLLPTLSRRFGLGKAPLYGVWSLPAAALLLLGVWIAVFRLLARELR